MNITFFIGNGFDINLGLNTKYSSFYPYFIEHARDDNMIKKWIDGNEKYWADLEEKLGQELTNISADDLEQFYEDKDELDRLLIEYLEIEQQKYNIDDEEIVKKEFSRSMLQFFNELPINDIESIKTTLEKYKNEDYIYCYITFNYTNILDRIVQLYGSVSDSRVIATHICSGISKSNRIGKIIHIHGTTNEEMILGVNDESQVDNDALKADSIFLDTLIKKRMNYSIGQRKTENAISVIKDSHIVCIFGMSIGNTDKMWWEELINWLKTNEKNILIIFWKGAEDDFKKRLPSKLIRMNEKIRKEIFQKGKGNNDDLLYSKIKDRIMISYNSGIFSLPKVNK